jgi:S-adenosylmethionine:tRNA ribosyltransferase-isomerase
MNDPRKISIKDYTYTLPEERIAKYPLPERDISKLLVYKKGEIEQSIYRNIADYIPSDSLLIFNNTKVVEARLLFKKQSGGIIEIFCLEPHQQYADITTAMLQKEKVYWHCLVGGASKWKPGQILEKKMLAGNENITVFAKYIEKQADSFIIELSWTPAAYSFAEILHFAGAIPLPPYIKRSAEDTDKERYQTVYAQHDGSVAAPTAGLHFTENVFEELDKKNIQRDFVTLHVGAGTFKPVKTELMQEHEMHAEWIDVSKKTIHNIIGRLHKPVIAVGTTSLRTLESLYWIGLKCYRAKNNNIGWENTGQWEPYENQSENISAQTALTALTDWMEKNDLERLVCKTKLLIAPGYSFRIINGLITNFHQPQSTLLLLVAAMIGEDWKKNYDFALQHEFRFLSYGDGSLLWREG